jgi:hypothetical protein
MAEPGMKGEGGFEGPECEVDPTGHGKGAEHIIDNKELLRDLDEAELPLQPAIHCQQADRAGQLQNDGDDKDADHFYRKEKHEILNYTEELAWAVSDKMKIAVLYVADDVSVGTVEKNDEAGEEGCDAEYFQEFLLYQLHQGKPAAAIDLGTTCLKVGREYDSGTE